MPRVALLIADDVGLGKTIEAGLVVQELLLRHRARRVLVVCPAPLTIQWRDEMRDKFGLSFSILDASTLKELRRTHGLLANPFTVFPRTIISLQWLRTPRVQRLLDEVLDPSTRHQGFFDLLVVDEAHHCAPPAPAQGRLGYAVDSLQTRAVRRASEHSQHRLFLSATPHNGYSESWEALLELVDDRRFARGVEPDPQAVSEVVVRRLKDEIVDADGRKEFAEVEAALLDLAETGRQSAEKGQPSDQAADLRRSEWELLSKPTTQVQDDDFLAVSTAAPDGFSGLLHHVVKVERLREVQASISFTRIDAPYLEDRDNLFRAPLADGHVSWVPALERRGEGIFLQLPESAVASWSESVVEHPHVVALRQAYGRWRANRDLEPDAGFPIARFLLVHTLSHLLLRTVALECGY
jgi:hypothetical protein